MNDPIKVGDLVVVVRRIASPQAHHMIGLIGTVLKLVPMRTFRVDGSIRDAALVRFSHPVKWASGRMNDRGFLPVSALRPIRPEPGQDETLTWAPVPSTLETVGVQP